MCGLAKHAVDVRDDGVTRTDAILGTPAYVANSSEAGRSIFAPTCTRSA